MVTREKPLEGERNLGAIGDFKTRCNTAHSLRDAFVRHGSIEDHAAGRFGNDSSRLAVVGLVAHGQVVRIRTLKYV